MSVIEKNKTELEAMVFALAERNKPTIVAALYETESARDAVIHYLNQVLDNYQALTLDFKGKKVDSLLQFLRQALPAEAQQRDAAHVTHLVHLVRLGPLLSEVKAHKVKASALAAQINLERERYFQEFKAVFVLWLSRHSYNRLRLDDAPDFMDWVAASFVIESTEDEAVASPPFSPVLETQQMRTQAELARLRQKAVQLQRSVNRIELRPQLNARDKKAYFNLLRELGSNYTKTQDFGKAITALEKALALAKSNELFSPTALGQLLMDLGNAAAEQGKLEYALSAFQEALVKYQTEDDKLRIGEAYSRVGYIYLELGDLKQALSSFEKQAEYFEALYKSDPGNVEYKNGLAVSYQFLGLTYSTLGNLRQALTFFEQYNQLEKELHQAYPENVGFKNNLAVSFQFLGETHSLLGDLHQALAFFGEYAQLEKELYEEHSERVEFKNGLAISYAKLGSAHSTLGDWQQASTFFKQHNELMKELHEDYPQKLEFKKGLAVSYGKLGETYDALEDLQQALTFFKKYNQLEKELYAISPQNMGYKNGLAISYEKLGQAHSALGNLQKANEFFTRYSQLAEEIHKAYPQNMDFKKSWAISYARLGQTHSAMGDLDRALTFFKKEIRIFKELYEAHPQNIGFKNGLAISYYKLGAFSRDHTQALPQAKAYFQQAEQLWAELVRDAPRYAEFQQYLAQARGDIARLGV